MAKQILLSTTGTQSSVTITDLNGIQFVHPVVDFDLAATFARATISGSLNLQAAIASGAVTLEDENAQVIDETELYAVELGIPTRAPITPGTKTKLTYDEDGFVVSGADATTADIADSSNKRYVLDADLTKLSNLSGTNTGDNATNSQYSGLVSNANHTGDVTGSTVLTLATVNSNIGAFGSATATTQLTVNAKGLITAAAGVAIQIAQSQVTNLTTDLSGKQATLVSATNIKTINGSSLLGSGDLAIGGGGTVTSVSIVSANGFAGTVATPSTTPAVTMSVSITGLLKGNGTAVNTAVAGTDYVAPNAAITGATNTKITYDAKGLVTAGVAATTADINPSTNRNYVTDAELLNVVALTQYTSPDQTITASGSLTLAHGLGVIPQHFHWLLVCQVAQLGYAVGDLVHMTGMAQGNNQGTSAVTDSTNLYIRFGANAAVFQVMHKTTGATSGITPANWKVRFLVLKGL